VRGGGLSWTDFGPTKTQRDEQKQEQGVCVCVCVCACAIIWIERDSGGKTMTPANFALKVPNCSIVESVMESIMAVELQDKLQTAL
jgi:hypothetical protein